MKLLLPLLFSGLAMGGPLKIKDSSASFEASGIITIEGAGGKLVADKLSADKTHIWGTFKVPLKDLKTGMDLRDDHMLNKYLEVSKYPYAKLVMSKTLLGSKSFKGKLTIKKETREITGKFDKRLDKVTASFEINLADFPSVGTPSWKGVSMADEVTVSVSATISP